MNSLALIPPEHPLVEQLRAVQERLNTQRGAVHALKEKIVRQLLMWGEELEGMEFDGEGTFVREGIRERLTEILPESLMDAIRIDGLGWVHLYDEGGHTLIGEIHTPAEDTWARQETANRHRLHDLEAHTFTPYGINRYIDAKTVGSDNQPGPFRLSEDEGQATRAAMAADRIIAFAGVAQNIHMEEDQGEYRDLRVRLNLQNAIDVCAWVEENIPMEGSFPSALEEEKDPASVDAVTAGKRSAFDIGKA